MKVLDALDSKTIQAQIKEQVHKSSTVKTALISNGGVYTVI
jgi:hypothetical protein